VQILTYPNVLNFQIISGFSRNNMPINFNQLAHIPFEKVLGMWKYKNIPGVVVTFQTNCERALFDCRLEHRLP
jgi:hypothetical protein